MDLGTSTNEIVRDIRDAIAEGKVGLSKEAVQALIEENGQGLTEEELQQLKVKHVYGIDGYSDELVEVFSLYFDETNTVYDPKTNTKPGEPYLLSLSGILSDGNSKYALFNGVEIPLEFKTSQTNQITTIEFTVNDNGVLRLNHDAQTETLTVDNPNHAPSPLILYEKKVQPVKNFEPELIEKIYYDDQYKVYSLEDEHKVYWDTTKLESFKNKIQNICITIDGSVYSVQLPNKDALFIVNELIMSGFAIGPLHNNAGIMIQIEGAFYSPIVIYQAPLYSVVENSTDNSASGVFSHAEGSVTKASAMASHAEGSKTTAAGQQSHAEGSQTTASGSNSHAEGDETTAGGDQSHAEGMESIASGAVSHAEGERANAAGKSSHAEGTETSALGDYSHAEGNQTFAASKSQHVFGEFNVVDGESATQRGIYVEIVGNGTDDKRSNARTLDWSGNEQLAGSITLGAGTSNEITLTAGNLLVIMEKCGLLNNMK